MALLSGRSNEMKEMFVICGEKTGRLFDTFGGEINVKMGNK